MPAPDGLLVVDKPAGWTSHDVVGRARRLCATRKVGHAGTLDPMATGVLVVGIERATKILGLLTATDKSYAATVRLGQATATDDAEGDVLQSVSASGLTDGQIGDAVAALRGEIAQVPSAVSAVKVGGERLYKKARRGETAETVEIAARRVLVTEFATGAVRPAPGGAVDVDFRVGCSKGTYVRSLARDLGRALGVGGHLVALRREAIGPFLAREAWDLDAFVAAHRSEART